MEAGSPTAAQRRLTIANASCRHRAIRQRPEVLGRAPQERELAARIDGRGGETVCGDNSGLHGGRDPPLLASLLMSAASSRELKSAQACARSRAGVLPSWYCGGRLGRPLAGLSGGRLA